MDRIETWFIRGSQEAVGYRDPLLALANWYIAQSQYEQGWDRLIESLYILEKDEIYLVTQRAWAEGPYYDLARILYANQSLEKVYSSNLNQETIYQILYQLGLIYSEYGTWAQAQELFLEAFDQAPYHLEPMYALMAHYYFAQSNHVAYMFGLQGKKVIDDLLKASKTENSFETEEEVRIEGSRLSFYNDVSIYEYKFSDIFSVVSGFVGDYESGRTFARIAFQRAPEKEKQRIFKNFELYQSFLKVSRSDSTDESPRASSYYPTFQ